MPFSVGPVTGAALLLVAAGEAPPVLGPHALQIAQDDYAQCEARSAPDKAELVSVLQELRARNRVLAEAIIGRRAEDEMGSTSIRLAPRGEDITAALNIRDGLTNGMLRGWTSAQLLGIIEVIARKWPDGEGPLSNYTEQVSSLRADALKLAARMSRPFRGNLSEQIEESFARRREADRLRTALLKSNEDGSPGKLIENSLCKGSASQN